MIFINGIIANCEDLTLLNYRILKKDLQFDVVKDEKGNQYITTTD